MVREDLSEGRRVRYHLTNEKLVTRERRGDTSSGTVGAGEEAPQVEEGAGF